MTPIPLLKLSEEEVLGVSHVKNGGHRSLQKHHRVKCGCSKRIAPTLRELVLERSHLPSDSQCTEIFRSQRGVHLIGLLLYQMTRLNNFSSPEVANRALLQFSAALEKPEPFSPAGY